MCGRYNVTDSPEVRALMRALKLAAEVPAARRNIAPGAYGQFVIEQDGERRLLDGIWSLLIEPKPDGTGFRPNPHFSTFNARSDRLTSSPLWKRRYASKRAIIPASAFHEWVGKRCYNISQVGAAIAFGGLYEWWEAGDRRVPSFTIITVPPHPRLAHIHGKSLPLMLEARDFDQWLDPAFRQVDAFAALLVPRLEHAVSAVEVDAPTSLVPLGMPEIIAPD